MVSDIGEADPTFDASIKHIYSPNNQKAISMLNDKEWQIVQMRLGLVEGEEGMTSKPNFIAESLGMSIEEVEKSYKRAKRILWKNLVK
jgi:DNA-directed RNA polymerase sigma subunit (sigma70/sigma32)